MTQPKRSGQRKSRRRPVWLLPEDGIVDLIAIDLAVRGVRRVALTPSERRIAAASILAVGGTSNTIAKRLHMAHTTARALARQVSAAAS
ncbi:hypothetical protein [Actinomadura xylanilytica]|uniref:hypothetical protein n=1 Tax=Actinomadura xylanilytica TaxID=887459 RepID=UPI00255AB17D|nr:hypothetical protein [Actinomadura xylanilytica]MDL4777599.1 hypothetical protein [Actinomadura xylanilytica]